MLLAVNYSRPTAALLDDGRIALDLYKTTEWPEMIAEAERQRPAYVHFPFLAGRHDLEKISPERVETILATTATRYVNTHLAPRASDFGLPLTEMNRDHLPRLMTAMRQDIDVMVARYGRERVILENANWDPNYDLLALLILPDVITEVVESTGCGFLLDLAHARMAATYFGMDVYEYIEQLPTQALRELHIAGTLYDEGQARLVDHHPMTEADWELTEWALGQIHRGAWPEPALVALEYGGMGPAFANRSDPAVLASDVPRLAQAVAGLRQEV